MNREYRRLPRAAPGIERSVHADGSQFYCVRIVNPCCPLHGLFEHFLLRLSLSTDPLNIDLFVPASYVIYPEELASRFPVLPRPLFSPWAQRV